MRLSGLTQMTPFLKTISIRARARIGGTVCQVGSNSVKGVNGALRALEAPRGPRGSFLAGQLIGGTGSSEKKLRAPRNSKATGNRLG